MRSFKDIDPFVTILHQSKNQTAIILIHLLTHIKARFKVTIKDLWEKLSTNLEYFSTVYFNIASLTFSLILT